MDIDFAKLSHGIVEKLEGWVETAVKMLPNLVLAAVTAIAFWIIAVYTRKFLERILPRVSNNPAVNRILATSGFLLIILVGVFIALGILRLDKMVMSLLAGAGVIGIALGFAFQEIASNFIAGVLIAFQRPFSVGDHILVSGFEGHVTQINLRVTVIETFQGLTILIPNKTIYTSSITNFSANPYRRLDFVFGVSYSEDLEKVKAVTLEAVKNVIGRKKDREPELYFRNFADSAIEYDLRVWIDSPGDNYFSRATDGIILNIKKAYDANGIVIPFPIRTVTLDTDDRKFLVSQIREIQSPEDSV